MQSQTHAYAPAQGFPPRGYVEQGYPKQNYPSPPLALQAQKKENKFAKPKKAKKPKSAGKKKVKKNN